jgi:hypothetical protein
LAKNVPEGSAGGDPKQLKVKIEFGTTYHIIAK